MAIRQIRTIGDEILTKECKPVKEMNERTLELIEDMFETMYENNGVGLAAPQVGVRKRVVVIDVEKQPAPRAYTSLRTCCTRLDWIRNLRWVPCASAWDGVQRHRTSRALYRH